MSGIIFLKNKTVPKDPYYDVFTSSGISTSFIPLLDHIHAEMSLITQYLTSKEFLYDTKALIITSQRAVEALDSALSLIESDKRDIILHKIAFTVGPATEKVLKTLGFRNIEGGHEAGNGAVLSQLILSRLKKSQKVTFFTGETRRDIIPKTLLSNGFDLKEVVIYKTIEKPNIIQRFSEEFKAKEMELKNLWIIFFSPQGTAEIVSFLRGLKLSENIRIGSIGPTTETYLLENSIKPHLVASKPEAKSLLEGIISYEHES